MKTEFDGMRSRQVIKGFDKSEIHDVFSMYHHLTDNTAFLFLSLARCRNSKESTLKGRGF
jgi:hypothetical protein